MRRYVFFTNGPNLPPRGCFGTGFQARTSIFDFFSKTAPLPCSLGSKQYVFGVPNGGFREYQA